MQSDKLQSLWDVLEECADIRLDLEDTCDSFGILVEDIQTVTEELRDDLDRIQAHMSRCRSMLRSCTAHMRPESVKEDSGELPWV